MLYRNLRAARRPRAVCFALCTLLPSLALAADPTPPRERKGYQPLRLASEPLSLDGRLDEPIWSSSPPREDFVERSPVPGGAPKFKTSFQVLYDDEALYIGVHCEQPREPRVRSMRRDSGKLYSDDAIAIRFDPYLDRRTTFEFATNAAGAQVDLLILNKGNDSTFAYDALWEVATSSDFDGWSAEFKIPFSALGAPKDGAFGLDIQRFVAETNQMYQWSVIPQGVNHNDAAFYGDLTPIQGIKPGQPLYFTPFLLTSAGSTGTETSEGFDLKAPLGTIGTAQLSFRTDFAQVSPDNAFVNLGRFAVALPERRPFFLEGTEIFSFGNSSANQLFFSRRIGIEDDISGASVLVPLDLGVKTQGRSGPYSFGAMNVLTAEAPGLDPGVVLPRADYTVARVRRELGPTANTGLLLTYKQTLPNGADPARGLSLGWDGAAQFLDNRLQTSATAAFVHNDVRGEDGPTGAREGVSAAANADYSGDVFFAGGNASVISADFDPAVGFVPRRDIARTVGYSGATLRPKDRKIAAITMGVDGGSNVQASDGTLLDASAGGFFEINTKSGYGAGIGGGYGFERISDGFSPLPNQLVPAGDYNGFGFGISGSTPSNKDLRFSLNTSLDGAVRTPDAVIADPLTKGSASLSASIAADFGQRLTSSLSLSNTLIQTRTGDELARGNLFTANGSASFALNTAAIVDGTLRLFDAVDPGLAREVGFADARFFGNALGQLRFTWRFRPGSDLFLIYNERRDLGAQEQAPERSFVVKVAITFAFAARV